MSGQPEDSRHVKLIPLNFGYIEIPSDMLVKKSDTYGSLEVKIADLCIQNRQDTNLKILEERFGPWPCWRYPDGNTRIPRMVESLYLVDSKKTFLIATLRTEQDDVPLLVELPTQHNADMFLTRETLESAVKDAGFKLKSAKMHGTEEDIEDRPYEIVNFRGLPTFPTVFFITCTHSNLAFRFKTAAAFDKPIEAAYQTVIDQCRRLVESALVPTIFPLKLIHISRVLLHLVISTANSDQGRTEDLRRLYKIQRIIDKLDEMADTLATTVIGIITPREVGNQLDRIFFSCCKNHPGSMVVRQSYSAYRKLSLSDLEDLREQGYDTAWDPIETYDTFSDSSIESEFESSPQFLGETLKTAELNESRILPSSPYHNPLELARQVSTQILAHEGHSPVQPLLAFPNSRMPALFPDDGRKSDNVEVANARVASSSSVSPNRPLLAYPHSTSFDSIGAGQDLAITYYSPDIPDFPLMGPGSPATSVDAHSASDHVHAPNAAQASRRDRPTLPSNVDPSLHVLLQSIEGSSFYLNHEEEPRIGTRKANDLLRYVTERGGDLRGGPIGLGQSIYAFFIDPQGPTCMFCQKLKSNLQRGIECVRSHLDHRPYECGGRLVGCLRCEGSSARARFRNIRVLKQHIEDQINKRSSNPAHSDPQMGSQTAFLQQAPNQNTSPQKSQQRARKATKK